MDKQRLREQTIENLKLLSSDEKKQIEQSLHRALFQSDLWQEANSIGVTMSRGIEWDTRPIIERAWDEGKAVYVPKCDPEHFKLEFYRLTSFDQLETVYYGLLEPKPVRALKGEAEDIALLIVPGVVFNQAGYRVGFGGGYYDRYLLSFPHQTVSLISERQLVESLPVEPHDIAVQHLITESGIIT